MFPQHNILKNSHVLNSPAKIVSLCWGNIHKTCFYLFIFFLFSWTIAIVQIEFIIRSLKDLFFSISTILGQLPIDCVVNLLFFFGILSSSLNIWWEEIDFCYIIDMLDYPQLLIKKLAVDGWDLNERMKKASYYQWSFLFF